MRIVLPYTAVHPLTEQALTGMPVERMYVGATTLSYSRLLADLWRASESFLIIEHDIEPTAEAVKQAVECDCEWSCSPYQGAGETFEKSCVIDHALGFTRFRDTLIRQHPDAMDKANAVDDGGSDVPPGDWRRLDARLYHVLRTEGLEPHQHATVKHHHVYQYGCSCGEDH